MEGWCRRLCSAVLEYPAHQRRWLPLSRAARAIERVILRGVTADARVDELFQLGTAGAEVGRLAVDTINGAWHPPSTGEEAADVVASAEKILEALLDRLELKVAARGRGSRQRVRQQAARVWHGWVRQQGRGSIWGAARLGTARPGVPGEGARPGLACAAGAGNVVVAPRACARTRHPVAARRSPRWRRRYQRSVGPQAAAVQAAAVEPPRDTARRRRVSWGARRLGQAARWLAREALKAVRATRHQSRKASAAGAAAADRWLR